MLTGKSTCHPACCAGCSHRQRQREIRVLRLAARGIRRKPGPRSGGWGYDQEVLVWRGPRRCLQNLLFLASVQGCRAGAPPTGLNAFAGDLDRRCRRRRRSSPAAMSGGQKRLPALAARPCMRRAADPLISRAGRQCGRPESRRGFCREKLFVLADITGTTILVSTTTWTRPSAAIASPSSTTRPAGRRWHATDLLDLHRYDHSALHSGRPRELSGSCRRHLGLPRSPTLRARGDCNDRRDGDPGTGCAEEISDSGMRRRGCGHRPIGGCIRRRHRADGRRHAGFGRLVLAVILKLRRMARDRMTLAMMIGIPTLQLLLFGYAINGRPPSAGPPPPDGWPTGSRALVPGHVDHRRGPPGDQARAPQELRALLRGAGSRSACWCRRTSGAAASRAR